MIILREASSEMQVVVAGRQGSTGLYLRRGFHAVSAFGGEAWRVLRSTIYCCIKALRCCTLAGKDAIKQRVAAWILLAAQRPALRTLLITHH
jgi:hypothetical protein